MSDACAPGKIILLGEHAVVFGRPALAMPVRQVRACARIEPADDGPAGDVLITAPALGLQAWMSTAPVDDPLAAVTRGALAALSPPPFPALRLTIESTIPLASGLGSSAAVSVAIAGALNAHFDGALGPAEISGLAFEVERLHHGTPSGIDNTVVAFDRPVFFVRHRPPEPLPIGARLHFVIGDSGVPAPTATAVAEVRRRWQADATGIEAIFDRIAALVEAGRRSIVRGDAAGLGAAMNDNHNALIALGVSSPQLDALVAAARAAGALGAKLSGGGLGGNMIALTPTDLALAVADALRQAGAAGVIHTEAGP